MTRRVVLVANWMHDVGGVQTATRALAAALRAAGYGVRIVSMLPSTDRVVRADVARTMQPVGPLHRLVRAALGTRGGGTVPARLDLPARLIARLRLRTVALSSDVLVAMDVYAAEAVVRAGRGRVVVAQFHNSARSLEGTRDLDRLRALRGGLDALVALTETDRAVFEGWGFGHVLAIPNVVSRIDLGADLREPLVVALGRFTDVKRFDLLIGAWRRLPEVLRRTWRLEVRGGGPQEAALLRAADGDSSILVAGPTDDVGQLLGRAQILVLPSEFEGLPMVLLEAMAAGVACVATRSSPGVEQLVDGAGWLVPVGDETALSRALEEAITNESARLRAVRAADDRVARYAPETIAAHWAPLLGDGPRSS